MSHNKDRSSTGGILLINMGKILAEPLLSVSGGVCFQNDCSKVKCDC